MDFNLNEDQLAFADSAKALFADFCTPEQQVAYEAGSAGYMADLWQQCVDNGLSAIVLGEAAGGLEQGMTELMAVVIEQGRALAQVPLWQGQLALQAAAAFGAQADLGAEAIIALAEILKAAEVEAITPVEPRPIHQVTLRSSRTMRLRLRARKDQSTGSA